MILRGSIRWLALIVLIAGLAGCGGASSSTETPQPASSVPAGGTTSIASPALTPEPEDPIYAPGITGLFAEPGNTKVDHIADVPPIPASTYAAWDRQTVVVFDTAEAKEYSYEPGFYPSMSPDGTKLIYSLNAGSGPGQVILIDWATQKRTELDATGFARFIDNDRIFLGEDDTILDLKTGKRTPVTDSVDWLAINAARGGERHLHPTPDGQYVGLSRDPSSIEDVECGNLDPEAQIICKARLQEDWALIDGKTGDLLQQFRALRVVPAGPGVLILATSPQCDSLNGQRVWCEDAITQAGLSTQDLYTAAGDLNPTTNLFRIDVATGQAQFIATVRYDPLNWPLVASDRYVAWTESYCTSPAGHTKVYDMQTGQIMELDASFWLDGITPDGHLGIGEFGPRALLNLQTMQWDVVLPEAASNVGWTPDYRFAYVGSTLGHGGYCP